MADSLFQQLKRIGIDEELAHQVGVSLDPDHNASKKDVLVMQKAILQLQARTDDRYNEFFEKLREQQRDSDRRFEVVSEKMR